MNSNIRLLTKFLHWTQKSIQTPDFINKNMKTHSSKYVPIESITFCHFSCNKPIPRFQNSTSFDSKNWVKLSRTDRFHVVFPLLVYSSNRCCRLETSWNNWKSFFWHNLLITCSNDVGESSLSIMLQSKLIKQQVASNLFLSGHM